jgi:hypothetical protein
VLKLVRLHRASWGEFLLGLLEIADDFTLWPCGWDDLISISPRSVAVVQKQIWSNDLVFDEPLFHFSNFTLCFPSILFLMGLDHVILTALAAAFLTLCLRWVHSLWGHPFFSATSLPLILSLLFPFSKSVILGLDQVTLRRR